jgi:low affinity Fe/Cu permease
VSRRTRHPLRDLFHRAARATATAMGSPVAFVVAVAVVLGWAISGPLFGWSDTWQLVINTGTTIVTFLMVFLIQNTQNRDALAVHLKLDELLHALGRARNELVDLEDATDEELEHLRKEFERLRARAAQGSEASKSRARPRR